jgi:hypothetical protein
VVSELMPANGHRPDEVRLGDAPGNVLNIETLVAAVRLWWAAEPESFGFYVAKALTGVPPKAKRGQS